MIDAADSIVQAQGISSRLSSYRVVQSVANPSFGKKFLAQHKVTKQFFDIKVASWAELSTNMDFFDQQVKAMCKLSKSK